MDGPSTQDAVMNPHHIVPTLEDRGFILWESRAINTYLVNKFGMKKRERLMPSDMTLRATVERFLHFDLGTFYASMIAYFRPQFLKQEPADPEKGKALERSLALLDYELTGKDYVAGGTGVSLADISLLASLSALDAYQYNYEHHRNVTEWANRLKQQLPYYDETMDEGVNLARQWALKKRSENKTTDCM